MPVMNDKDKVKEQVKALEDQKAKAKSEPVRQSIQDKINALNTGKPVNK